MFGIAVFTLLPVLFLLEEHCRGKWAVERWKTRMAARGEKFEIERLVPPSPDDRDNGLPPLLLAVDQLSSSGLDAVIPPSTRFVAPGKVLLNVEQSQWRSVSSSKKAENNVTWSILGEELNKIRGPLNDVRAALKKPRLDAHLNYDAGFFLLLPHLGRLKRTATYLSGDSLNELHDGNLEKALEDLEALLSLGRCQQDELLPISQLVRITIAQISVASTWQALHASGWTDSYLIRLQSAWQSIEFIGAMGRSLEMERAMAVRTYANARRSARDCDAILTGLYLGTGPSPVSIKSLSELVDYIGNHFPDLCRKTVYAPLWQFAWSYPDELNYLQTFQGLIEAARQGATQKSGVPAAAFSKQLESKVGRLNYYNHMRFALSSEAATSLSRCLNKSVGCETLQHLVLTAIALQRYELRYQKTASDLLALVPEFLPELPTDYMNGRPLHYQVNTNGTFRLYSVGSNQRDDGGDPTPVSEQGNDTLSNPSPRNPTWLNGRDVIWPDRASPEEIAAYERSTERKK